jgi:hypothetical protein
MTADAKIGSGPTVDAQEDRTTVGRSPGGMCWDTRRRADEPVCAASEAVALELVPRHPTATPPDREAP